MKMTGASITVAIVSIVQVDKQLWQASFLVGWADSDKSSFKMHVGAQLFTTSYVRRRSSILRDSSTLMVVEREFRTGNCRSQMQPLDA